MQIQNRRILPHRLLIHLCPPHPVTFLIVHSCLVEDLWQHMPRSEPFAVGRVQRQRACLERRQTVLCRLIVGWEEGKADRVQEDKVALEDGREEGEEEGEVDGS